MMELIITPLLNGCSSSEQLILLLHFLQSFDNPPNYLRKKYESFPKGVKSLILFCILPFYILCICVLFISQP